MKKRLFAIPSFLAAGFLPLKTDAMPLPGASEKKVAPASVFERLRLKHLYNLAGHRSHSSHASHSSHRSSSGSGYTVPKTRNYSSTPPSSLLPNLGSKSYSVTPRATPSTPTPAPQPSSPQTFYPDAPTLETVPAQKTLPGNSNKFRQIAMRVQTALTVYGYYTSAIDGLIGPDSKVAISKFQEDWNLKVTGTITPELLDALSISAQ